MTILQSGRERMAFLSGSTWTYYGIGTASTAASTGQTDLVSTITPRRLISNATTIYNTCTFVTFFTPSQNNSASNVVEIAGFDASTAGNMLFRVVNGTSTFTAFTKDSSKSLIITFDLTISS